MKVAVVPQFKKRVDVEIQTMTGTPEVQSFMAIFKGMSRAEYDALMARAEAAFKDGKNGDDLVVAEVLQGWEGVEDAQGNPLPFNADNMAKTWNEVPGARVATVRTFMMTVLGARTGN